MDNCIRTKIVGVTYRNEDGSRRQDIISELSTGESLKLVDMATDEFPEAIGVFDLADQQCGFLQKSLAIDLRNSGKSIEDVSVDVLEVTGGNGRSYGCNIRLIIDTDYLCNIVIGDHGSMKIDAPLVDQHVALNQECLPSHIPSVHYRPASNYTLQKRMIPIVFLF